MELHRAKCIEKDQSYVLAVMGREALEKVIFPLGEYESKSQVRAEAERRGLPMSAKPDSYDICFIADGDTRGFLSSHLGSKAGKIVDTEGKEVGTHSGAYQYTIGQRKGLNLGRPAADGRPRYVLGTDMKTNTVVVGASELLSVDAITATDAVLLTEPDDPTLSGQAEVTLQYRAHGQQVPAKVYLEADGTLRAELLEPTRAVASGQSLVVYAGDRAICEATIEEAFRQEKGQ